MNYFVKQYEPEDKFTWIMSLRELFR